MKLEHIENNLEKLASLAASSLGKKGYEGLKKVSTAAQRQAWREKGAAATRRNFAAKRKAKNLKK